MKKAAYFLFLLILYIFMFPIKSLADEFEIKSDEDFNKAIVKTQKTCRYSLMPKLPNWKILEKDESSFFNSFFAGHTIEKNDYVEKLISVGHGLVCKNSPQEVFDESEIGFYKTESFESTVIAVSIIYEGTYFGGGMIIKAQDTEEMDLGIFEIDMPVNNFHKHIALGKIEWVFVGNQVVVRGFMNPDEPDFDVTRFKVGYVEQISAHTIRIAATIYPGMSGSVVVIKRKNKWYTVGVVSQFKFDKHFGIVDILWASVIPKDFLK